MAEEMVTRYVRIPRTLDDALKAWVEEMNGNMAGMLGGAGGPRLEEADAVRLLIEEGVRSFRARANEMERKLKKGGRRR